MLTKFSLLWVVAAVLLSLAACGGGGGNDPTTAASTSPSATTHLGSRAMPGTGLTVTAETPLIAGQPASVLIEAPDIEPGAQMSMGVGSSHESLAPATMTTLSEHRWRANMTLPEPLTDTCFFVSLTLADSSVLESGKDDFVISQ